MIEITPKKSLGQNFLTDRNMAKKIVGLLELTASDYVIEIGPGTGALTVLLLETGANLTCIEIDQRAIVTLNNKFPTDKFNNLTIYNDDFIKFDLKEEIKNRRVKIIGNLPYYLTSNILFKIFECNLSIDRAILTMQKEVAQRLTAKIRTKDYGILTVALNLLGKAKMEFNIPPSCFFPKPKVMSSVISLRFDKTYGPEFDYANFDYINFDYINIMKLVRASFNYRRKKLANSLKGFIKTFAGTDMSVLLSEAELHGIDFFTKRAEELNPDDFLELYKFINSIKNSKKTETNR